MMLKVILRALVLLIAFIPFTNSVRLAAAGDWVFTNKLSFDVSFYFYSGGASGTTGATQIVKGNSTTTVTVPAGSIMGMLKVLPSDGITNANVRTDGASKIAWGVCLSTQDLLGGLNKDSNGNYGITFAVKDVYYPKKPAFDQFPGYPEQTKANRIVMIDSNFVYSSPIDASTVSNFGDISKHLAFLLALNYQPLTYNPTVH
jgi:hypothetical protein